MGYTDDIAAYRRMESDLVYEHIGKWVLVHNTCLVGTYETWEDAARLAIDKFGRLPYLIKQIGL